jgi:hypothetical protein
VSTCQCVAKFDTVVKRSCGYGEFDALGKIESGTCKSSWVQNFMCLYDL